MRVVLAACLSVVASAALSGCASDGDTVGQGCTDAGRADTAAVASALQDLDPGAGTFTDCESGMTTGAMIDPFARAESFAGAERAFGDHFDCSTPQRSTNPVGDDVSDFTCTIAGVRAEVQLDGDRDAGPVSAWVTPAG
ncbi:hypothetical protein [Nocardioides lijunqiniae]|uniref:hypothetical protein n=1 Tax=Nocardioides lijunqiniae TaxID=2760832 RepID=UPI001878A2E5|nr:hypothetical protein [Nocardioides lijunqiniae]